MTNPHDPSFRPLDSGQIHGATSWWPALKADTYREYGYFALGRLLAGFLTRRTFRAVVTMRLCQAAAASSGAPRILLPALKLLHRFATRRAGIDLSWRTAVGPGFKLTHGWGTVVNPGARIGRNVTLFHGVTLGRRDHMSDDGERRIEYPTLEDDVWCGPHCIIVGGVTIGRGSRIAGGAFVTTDVPPQAVVVGNPAVIVKVGCSPYGGNLAPL